MEQNTIDITVGDDDVKPGTAEQVSDAEQLDELERLRAESAELKDKYIRLHAEFDNYRKRVQKEKDEIYKYGAEPMVSDLLNVIDNLEAALSHVTDMTNPLAQGIDLTLKELKKILGKYGLADIEAEGKAFDPAYHHAMTEVQRDDLYDKTVVDVFRKGYTYKERVLRASMVSVSKSAVGEDDLEETSESKEEKTEFNDIKEGNNG